MYIHAHTAVKEYKLGNTTIGVLVTVEENASSKRYDVSKPRTINSVLAAKGRRPSCKAKE
jgi:hypothetical protein